MRAHERLQRSSGRAQGDRRASVRQRCLDLRAVADDALVAQQALDVGAAVAGEDIGQELGECVLERVAPGEDRPPGQSGLEGLEADPFEQPALVEDREAPLLVVVALEQRIAVAEAAPPRRLRRICVLARDGSPGLRA